MQAHVIAGILAGKSKTEVHRETGLGRGTIKRILSRSEISAILASYQDQVRDLVPAAIRLCARKLRGRDASWKLAIEILKGCGVLISKSAQDVHHIADEVCEWTDDELRRFIKTGEKPVSTPGNA